MPILYVPNFGPVKIVGTAQEVEKKYRAMVEQYATPQKATFGSSFAEGISTLGGLDEAAAYANNPTPENRDALLARKGKRVSTSFDDVEQEFRKGNYLKGLSGLMDFAAQTAGGSIGSQVAPAAAGLAGFLSPLPGGASLGYTGVSTSQYFVENMTRQAEEAARAEKEQRQVQDPNTARALLAAGGQAILDRAGFGLLGFGAKKAGTELAKETFGQTVRRGAVKGVAAEAPQEVAQQGLERWQAGLDLTGEEAGKEYKEALAGAALLGGPLGATGRFNEKRQAQALLQPVPTSAPEVPPLPVNESPVPPAPVAAPVVAPVVPTVAPVAAPVAPAVVEEFNPAVSQAAMDMEAQGWADEGAGVEEPVVAAQPTPEPTVVPEPVVATPVVQEAQPEPITAVEQAPANDLTTQLNNAKVAVSTAAKELKINSRAGVKRALAADFTDPKQYTDAVTELSDTIFSLTNGTKTRPATEESKAKAQALQRLLEALPAPNYVRETLSKGVNDAQPVSGNGDLAGQPADTTGSVGGNVPTDSVQSGASEAPVGTGDAGVDLGVSGSDVDGAGGRAEVQPPALSSFDFSRNKTDGSITGYRGVSVEQLGDGSFYTEQVVLGEDGAYAQGPLNGKSFSSEQELKTAIDNYVAPLYEQAKKDTISEVPRKWVQGTSKQNKAAIEASGVFDATKAKNKFYDYSELGPSANYFTRPEGWWLDKNKAAMGRAAKYDALVEAELTPDAKVKNIQTPADWDAFAQELGYESGGALSGVLFVDSPSKKELAEAKKAERRITAAGYDGFYIGPSMNTLAQLEGKPTPPAADQLVIYNKKTIKPVVPTPEVVEAKPAKKSKTATPLEIDGTDIAAGDRFDFMGEETTKLGRGYLRPAKGGLPSTYTLTPVSASKVRITDEKGESFTVQANVLKKFIAANPNYMQKVEKGRGVVASEKPTNPYGLPDEDVQAGIDRWNENAEGTFPFDELAPIDKATWIDSDRTPLTFKNIMRTAELRRVKPDIKLETPVARVAEGKAVVEDKTSDKELVGAIESRLLEEGKKEASGAMKSAKGKSAEEDLTASEKIQLSLDRENLLQDVEKLRGDRVQTKDVTALAKKAYERGLIAERTYNSLREIAVKEKDPEAALDTLKTKLEFADPDVMYSLSTGKPLVGVDPKLADQISDRYRAGKGAPEIVVVRDPSQLPPSVAAQVKNQGITPKGFMDLSDGKVYILPENNENLNDLLTTFEHEIVGHYGMRAFLGKAYEATMKAAMDNPTIKAKLTGPSRTLRDIEEAIAETAELGVKGKLPSGAAVVFGRLKALLNRFLRNLGMTRALSDSELYGILANAKAYVETGKGKGKGEAQVYSNKVFREGDQTDTPAFKRWFGDSKVVDKNGKPLVVYHGTTSDISIFDASKTKAAGVIFTTPNPDSAGVYAQSRRDGVAPNVMPLYVSIARPAYIKANEYSFSALETAATRGDIDGILVVDDSGEIVIAAPFDPSQIKSAIGNNGEFDAANPDIRFRLADYSKAVSGAINKIESPYTKERVDRAYDAISTLPDDVKRYSLQLVNMNAVTEGINRLFTKSTQFGTQIGKAVGERAGLVRKYEENTLRPVLERGEQLAFDNPEDYKKTNDLAYLSREYRMDASKNPYEANYLIKRKKKGSDESEIVVDPRFEELKAMYDALPKNMQELYKDVAAAGDTMFEDFMGVLTKLLDAQIATGVDPSVANRIKDRLLGRTYEVRTEEAVFDDGKGGKTNIARFSDYTKAAEAKARNPGAMVIERSEKRIQPYFAHIRPGKYLLSYEVDGKKHYPSFVSERARNEAEAELRAKGIKPTKFEFDRSGLRTGKGTDYELIEQLLRQLDTMELSQEQQDDFYNILVDALPEAEALGNLKAAKEYGGFNRDIVRGLAVSGTKMATLIANSQFQADIVPIRNAMEAADEILSGKRDIVMERAQQDDPTRTYDDLTDEEIRVYLNTGRINRMLTPEQYRELVELRDSSKFDADAYRKNYAAYSSELRNRMGMVQNPLANRFANAVAGYSYKFLLGANVASALIQVAQIPSVAMPILGGKYGFPKASKYLWEATKLFAKTGASRQVVDGAGKVSTVQGNMYTKSIGNLPDAELKKLGLYELIKEAENRGALRTSVVSEVNRAMYNQAGYKSTLLGRIGTKVDLALSGMFHVSEELNREATLVAAFRLAKESGMSTAEAVEEALRMTDYINGQTSAENAPSITKNTIGKIAFTFKRYAVSMLYMQLDTARRALKDADPVERQVARRQIAALYGSAFAVSGLFGMPFMGVVRMLANAMLGDDDEPYDLKIVAENNLGGMIARGPLSWATGLDIGSRVKQTDFLLNDEVPNSSGLVEDILLSLGGPAVGIAKNFMRGSELIAGGEFERGVETMMPSAVKNVMKAMRFAGGGAETLEGEKIYDDFGPYSVIAQAVGFTPLELAQAYSVRGYLKEMDKAITDRRSSLLGAASVARIMGDDDTYNNILSKIEQFNEDHPENPITSASLAKSLKTKTKSREDSYRGVSLNKRMKDVLMEDIMSIDEDIED